MASTLRIPRQRTSSPTFGVVRTSSVLSQPSFHDLGGSCPAAVSWALEGAEFAAEANLTGDLFQIVSIQDEKMTTIAHVDMSTSTPMMVWNA